MPFLESTNRHHSVPPLKDLFTKYVGENLGEIVKWSLRCEDDGDDQPLLTSPFDLIRNWKTSSVNFCFFLFINNFLFVSASSILPAILNVTIRKMPRNKDHLRLLITKHLESLDLSYLNYFGKDFHAAALLLSTAALLQSVYKISWIFKYKTFAWHKILWQF